MTFKKLRSRTRSVSFLKTMSKKQEHRHKKSSGHKLTGFQNLGDEEELFLSGGRGHHVVSHGK